MVSIPSIVIRVVNTRTLLVCWSLKALAPHCRSWRETGSAMTKAPKNSGSTSGPLMVLATTPCSRLVFLPAAPLVLRLSHSSSGLLRCSRPFLRTAGLSRKASHQATLKLIRCLNSMTRCVPRPVTPQALVATDQRSIPSPGISTSKVPLLMESSSRSTLRPRVDVHQEAFNILRSLRVVQCRMRYEKVLWRACVPLGRQILIEELFCDYVEPPEHSSISNKDGGGPRT
jgi:hypothetical protein